jgi:hypothetical protein
MTGAAQVRAAIQREELLELCAEAHEEAADSLARLNRAERRIGSLRGLQSEHCDGCTPRQSSVEELRAHRAEEIEASLRQQFNASNARAVQLASSVQGRRVGLNNLLRSKTPR